MAGLEVVEICAGAGGQSLGLHLAGFEHRAAVELDETAASTLRLNLSRLARESGTEVPIVAVGDVADSSVWRPEDYKGVSLLAGGVPCPPFSVAGQQLGAEDERDLFAWAVELAGVIQPQAVMLENVRGLSMPRFAGYRQAVLDRLEELGYVADWQLLEACDYGVPQLRPRTVLVALRPQAAAAFEWPAPTPATGTVGSTLKDLMGSRGWRGAAAWAQRADGIAPTIVGGSKKHGGADLGPTRAKRAWAAMGVDALGVADEAPPADAPRDFVPKLTTDMVARLQGWLGDEYEWHFEGRKTSRYRQIGNAFPPPVARAVGSSIAAALQAAPTGSVIEHRLQASHGAVYRVLKEEATFISTSRITEILDGQLSREEIEQHVLFIRRDFVVEEDKSTGEKQYRLGRWKAFQGQDDHARHDAFAAPRRRSKIS